MFQTTNQTSLNSFDLPISWIKAGLIPSIGLPRSKVPHSAVRWSHWSSSPPAHEALVVTEFSANAGERSGEMNSRDGDLMGFSLQKCWFHGICPSKWWFHAISPGKWCEFSWDLRHQTWWPWWWIFTGSNKSNGMISWCHISNTSQVMELSYGGSPSCHPFRTMGFSLVNDPFWGPMTMETPQMNTISYQHLPMISPARRTKIERYGAQVSLSRCL